MATLYDFPLELLNSKIIQQIFAKSSTISHVSAGYNVAVPKFNDGSEEVKALIAMMDFFSTTGILKKSTLDTNRVKTLDDVIAPGYKISNGFGNFPLDSFIGQIQSYLKTSKTEPAVAAKATNPSVVKNPIVTEIQVNDKAATVPKAVVDSAIPKHDIFYFRFKKEVCPVAKDLLLAERLLIIHERAKSRRYTCDLTLANVKALFKRKTCYYTGVTFSETDSNLFPTLDRINPNLGYMHGNVVLCTSWSNQFKAEILENPSSRLGTDLKTLSKFVQTIQKSSFEKKHSRG